MEILLAGSVFILALNAAISGGAIDIDGRALKAKATLRPLWKGLKGLREAFGLDKRLRASYGIRETTVKLSKAEYTELMTTPVKGTGGFQGFFGGLQYRVDKNRKELTLSREDLDFIYRHKAHPTKGGWQGRLQKVFGRHFP